MMYKTPFFLIVYFFSPKATSKTKDEMKLRTNAFTAQDRYLNMVIVLKKKHLLK